MTSYPYLPGPIPFTRRRPTKAAGCARPARRIAIDARRRPENHRSPW